MKLSTEAAILASLVWYWYLVFAAVQRSFAESSEVQSSQGSRELYHQDERRHCVYHTDDQPNQCRQDTGMIQQVLE